MREGIDLRLNNDQWERTERSAAHYDIRVALLHSIPMAGGIVVADGYVMTLHSPAELVKMAECNTARTAKYRTAPETQAVEAWREHLTPGSRDASRVINEGVATSLAVAINEVKEAADAELAPETAADLAAHWKTLPGAQFPSPLRTTVR